MIENDSSGLTSEDVLEIVSSVMDEQFSRATPEQRKQLNLLKLLPEDVVMEIDQDFIEPAFRSPTVEPAPLRRATRAALRDMARGAGKAARDLAGGKGPRNFDVNETLRRRLGR